MHIKLEKNIRLSWFSNSYANGKVAQRNTEPFQEQPVLTIHNKTGKTAFNRNPSQLKPQPEFRPNDTTGFPQQHTAQVGSHAELEVWSLSPEAFWLLMYKFWHRERQALPWPITTKCDERL